MLKPTRVDIGPSGFRVHLASRPAEEWAGLAYRSGGWPLCPRCGADALRSLRAGLRLTGKRLEDARAAVLEELEPRRRELLTQTGGDQQWRREREAALVAAGARPVKPTDEMRCHVCQWNGGVPRRDEAEAWGKLGR